ncbi:TIGR02281 family clan AA aspartic protease [Octadecabacter sp. CECT 8868]|uniref:retropepsin-like aspartic protease family protein n=1 Tax=Octadecabacter algicola TaxID=2909342 RepID=UPI001F38AD3C|nr:TIGR02281 family clan AA aspartic protease [Octadecabacter algicola]MCF2903645.1 TIGR02281 family clan AA aspartic protease [Octadecabacter algicola]
METEQIIALILLIIVGLPLLASMFSSSTQLRNALLWVVIFLGGIGIANNWTSIHSSFVQPQASFIGDRIEVPKGPDNHFHLTLMINSVPVDFLVDTGASQMVLTQDDAARVGLDADELSYIGIAYTANGEVATAPVRLDTVDLGDIRDRRVRASVNSGDMDKSLLGMSYLSRFESIEIRQNLLILNR